METPTNTQKALALILDSESIKYMHNGRLIGGLGSFNYNIQGNSPGVTRSRLPEIIAGSPTPGVVTSENADRLLKLHSVGGAIDKLVIEAELLSLMSGGHSMENLSYLAVYVFWRLGRICEAIELIANLPPDSNGMYGQGNGVAMLGLLLRTEWDEISPDAAETLQGQLSNLRKHTDMHNIQRLVEIRVRLLDQALDGVNFEINADRDKVVTIWEQKLGSESVQQQIGQIEDLFLDEKFDKLGFATCLGRVRVLLVSSLKQLAEDQRLNSRVKAPLTKNPEDADVIKWFQDQGLISEEARKLIRSVYNLCSNEGAHSAQSRREYARIAKNMTYECLLLVADTVSV